jgi:hypothetical protein
MRRMIILLHSWQNLENFKKIYFLSKLTIRIAKNKPQLSCTFRSFWLLLAEKTVLVVLITL